MFFHSEFFFDRSTLIRIDLILNPDSFYLRNIPRILLSFLLLVDMLDVASCLQCFDGPLCKNLLLLVCKDCSRVCAKMQN